MHSSLWFFMIFIYQLLTFYKKKHIEFIDKVIVRYYDKSVYLFNPTIINRDSKLGLFARLVDQKDQKRQFVYLDDIDFDNKELILYDYKKYLVPVKKINWAADPRSFFFDNHLFISFNDGHSDDKNNIYVSKFYKDYDALSPKKIKCGFNRRKIEKNWGFFQHKDSLLCVYSYNPFKVLLINEKEDYFLANNLHIHQFKSFNGKKGLAKLERSITSTTSRNTIGVFFKAIKDSILLAQFTILECFYLMLSPHLNHLQCQLILLLS